MFINVLGHPFQKINPYCKKSYISAHEHRVSYGTQMFPNPLFFEEPSTLPNTLF